MASVTYNTDSVVYTAAEKDGGEEFRIPVDLSKLSEDVLKKAAVCGLYIRANQHTASEKKDKAPTEAIRIVTAMIEGMLARDSIDKEASERAPRAYVDNVFVMALAQARANGNLAAAQTKYKEIVTDKGFTSKADATARVTAILEKLPDVKAVYDQITAGDAEDVDLGDL